MKRMTCHNHSKSKEIQVEEISHLTNQEQAELIADKLAEISQSYKGVELTDPVIPPFTVKDILQVSVSKVKDYISRIKPKKSTPPRDITAKIVKEFSEYLCVPLTDIINTSLKTGPWPSCYKKEVITLIPKEYPVLLIDMLRPILCLLTFNKVQEVAICEMVLSDMSAALDPTQYWNRRRTGIYRLETGLLPTIPHLGNKGIYQEWPTSKSHSTANKLLPV